MDADEIRLVLLARQYAVDGRAQELRARAGLSFREFARLADVSPSTVVTWERHKRRPRGETAVRYARALIEIERLVGAA
jgi:DNA-binding XRE family transcriptional regulator